VQGNDVAGTFIDSSHLEFVSPATPSATVVLQADLNGQGFIALCRRSHRALEGCLRMQRVSLIRIYFSQVGALRCPEFLQRSKIGFRGRRDCWQNLVEGLWY